jgi:hypothetical protein
MFLTVFRNPTVLVGLSQDSRPSIRNRTRHLKSAKQKGCLLKLRSIRTESEAISNGEVMQHPVNLHVYREWSLAMYRTAKSRAYVTRAGENLQIKYHYGS